jgi:hypothetical protein
MDGNGEFYVKFSTVNFQLLIAPSKHFLHEQHTFSSVRYLLFVESNSTSKVAARERYNFKIYSQRITSYLFVPLVLSSSFCYSPLSKLGIFHSTV